MPWAVNRFWPSPFWDAARQLPVETFARYFRVAHRFVRKPAFQWRATLHRYARADLRARCCGPLPPRRDKAQFRCASGDALILTKGIGIGIYSAAFKKGALSDAAYAEMIASTTLLNRVGHALAQDSAVHGITDITGFVCSVMRSRWRAAPM